MGEQDDRVKRYLARISAEGAYACEAEDSAALGAWQERARPARAACTWGARIPWCGGRCTRRAHLGGKPGPADQASRLPLFVTLNGLGAKSGSVGEVVRMMR